ncbi:DNA-binding protein [Chitinimonas sp.]|uniref:DNA-binding protein n=1 Tax=Chitinimonas sp. TaxID=1934313 RepID=UPI0035B2ED5F
MLLRLCKRRECGLVHTDSLALKPQAFTYFKRLQKKYLSRLTVPFLVPIITTSNTNIHSHTTHGNAAHANPVTLGATAMKPKTPEQVKQSFRQSGMTFTDWARNNGYPKNAVYRVLNGFDKANYGRAHEIAVKLGLKPNPEQLAA